MSTPQVVFGSGHIHITQISDAKGNKINPPQVIAAPAVQNISADFGKADTKMMYGQKEFAIHAAQGKKSTEVSFEVGEMYAQMLNTLYFGQTLIAGSNNIYRDTTGSVLADGYTTQMKIHNVVTLNIAKWVAHTSVLIKTAGVNTEATLSAGLILATNQVKIIAGRYYFSAEDIGKDARITYVALDKTTQGGTGGTTVTSIIKIPKSLVFDISNFSNAWGIQSLLVRDNYSTFTTPNANHYQFSNNGILILNSTATANTLHLHAITHSTDGQLVKSYIDSLPATGVVMIIDPPSSAVFQSNQGVTLSYGTSGGLALGESLAQSQNPVSGQYDVDSGGIYTFSADDIGSNVIISYLTDFIFKNITSPDGSFVEDKGVRNTDGMPFTRVAITSPLAILPMQYAVSDSGAYYFDSTHHSETVYIDYEYASEKGVTLAIENNDMGSTPIVSLDISGQAEGQEWLIKYPRAIPKAFGFATKLDDFGMHKVTFEIVADRVSNKVGTVYLTA